MIVEAYNIKYEQRTKVWDITGPLALEKLQIYNTWIEQGNVDDSLLQMDICPSRLQLEIPDCDPMDIDLVYVYTKEELEKQTLQKVISFNVRY